MNPIDPTPSTPATVQAETALDGYPLSPIPWKASFPEESNGFWHIHDARGNCVATVWGRESSTDSIDANFLAEAVNAYDPTQAELTALRESNGVLVEALRDMVSVVRAAGSLNLSRGVDLGPTVWYVKMEDALNYADVVLSATTKEGGASA